MAGCSECGAGAVEQVATNSAFRRVLWIAFLANFVMFLVELAASYIGDSLSLQADALDFFGDSTNYAISLFVLGMSIAHRARASLFKSLSMASFGLWVIGTALYRAVTDSEPDPLVMSGTAVLALGVNVGIALLLYRYRVGDSNMQSIWLCSRNDAIGNLAVIFAAAGVFASSTRWPDLAVATLIAGLNLWAALQVTRLAIQELQLGRRERDMHTGVSVESRLT
ncbi:MAG: cation transporter [Gammaproteobacteria bacterium]|nr:cation transporter [Gammaproteobacteria bacterium]